MNHEYNKIYCKKERGGKKKNRFFVTKYQNKDYVIMETRYYDYFIFDYKNLEKIINISANWSKDASGFIVSRGLYLHNYIKNHSPNNNNKGHYYHINGIKNDNREINIGWTEKSIKANLKRNTNVEKYNMLKKEIFEALDKGQLEKYINYSYEKGRSRFAIKVDKKFPYGSGKSFTCKKQEELPALYEKAKQYIRDKTMEADNENQENKENLKNEYYEILENEKNYLEIENFLANN